MPEQGRTYTSENSTQVESFLLNYPLETSEQHAIATAFSDMDDTIAALQTKLKITRHVKQGMMQQLLTGRIRLV